MSARLLFAAAAAVGCGDRRPARLPPEATPPAPLTLKLQTEIAEDTGSMHYADSVSIESNYGALELVSQLDETSDDFAIAPIVEHQIPVGSDGFLLLGWYSFGEGMQTIDALYVQVESDRLRIRDRLTYTADRRHAALLVQDRFGLSLGLPLPSAEVHNPDMWEIRSAKQALSITDIRHSRSTAVFPTPALEVAGGMDELPSFDQIMPVYLRPGLGFETLSRWDRGPGDTVTSCDSKDSLLRRGVFARCRSERRDSYERIDCTPE